MYNQCPTTTKRLLKRTWKNYSYQRVVVWSWNIFVYLIGEYLFITVQIPKYYSEIAA